MTGPGRPSFAPLAPTTLAIRHFRGFRGTKALLVQGDLPNSMPVVKDGDRLLVGVLRTARNHDRKSLADVAALQEPHRRLGSTSSTRYAMLCGRIGLSHRSGQVDHDPAARQRGLPVAALDHDPAAGGSAEGRR